MFPHSAKAGISPMCIFAQLYSYSILASIAVARPEPSNILCAVSAARGNVVCCCKISSVTVESSVLWSAFYFLSKPEFHMPVPCLFVFSLLPWYYWNVLFVFRRWQSWKETVLNCHVKLYCWYFYLSTCVCIFSQLYSYSILAIIAVTNPEPSNILCAVSAAAAIVGL